METINNKTDELQQQLTEVIDTVENVEEKLDETLSQISPDDIQNEFTLYMELLEAEDIERNTQMILGILNEDKEDVEYELAA